MHDDKPGAIGKYSVFCALFVFLIKSGLLKVKPASVSIPDTPKLATALRTTCK